MTMTTIFEAIKGYSMKGIDFEYQLGMLLADAEMEVEIAKELGYETSFAREIALSLSRKVFIEDSTDVSISLYIEAEDDSIPF